MPQQAPPSYAAGQATMPGSSSLDPRTSGATSSSGSNKAVLWIVGGIIVVALAGVGIWRYMVSSKVDGPSREQMAEYTVQVLQGDMYMMSKNFDAARTSYDSAQALMPGDTTVSGKIVRLEAARMFATLNAPMDTVAVPLAIDEEVPPPVVQEAVVREREPIATESDGRKLTGLIDSDGDTYDYEGESHNGKPHGTGTATYRTGKVAMYKGEWRNGIRHGQGMMKWDDGDTYDGAWDSGIRTGRGTYKWNAGGRYTGEWLNAKMHGQGKYTWADGDTYDGDWNENMMEGDGVFLVVNGNVTNCADCKKYTGQWEDDKKEGYGRCYSASGELLYAGTFRGDSPTGTYPIP